MFQCPIRIRRVLLLLSVFAVGFFVWNVWVRSEAKSSEAKQRQPEPTQVIAGLTEKDNTIAAVESSHGTLNKEVKVLSEEQQITTVAPRHPSDLMISTARLIRERWSQADAIGNRERAATYHHKDFKYSRLRVVERWSGKDRSMTSRLVMVGDHLLVAPRSGVSTEDLTKRLTSQGFRVGHLVDQSCLLVSVIGDSNDPDELPRAMNKLAAIRDSVEYAEPDYIVWPCLEPNDPAYIGKKLWGLHNRGGVSGYTADADIDAPEAWGYRTDASSVVVAVTDTGIRYDHQDLVANMWHNPGETPGDGVDNDGNGKIDDIYGYDAYGNDGDPMDDQGHGTHCAGTIGARGNNGIGSTGVAWQVQLMAGRFLGAYGGTTSDAIKVIDYCRLKGADVISASWGGGGPSNALKNAITACANADIPFIAAAGNSGTNNDAYPHYPSSYKVPNIVAVAASNATDVLTDFSCYGRGSVDIAAPGWQIWSSYIGSTSDYRYLQGTSMATPKVSGALALARAEYPTADYIQLIKALYHSVDKKAALNGKILTGGRLNVHKLLSDSLFAPDNDSLFMPEVLVGAYATWSGSNRNASRATNEWTYSPAIGSRTLWYAWQAPYDGFTTVKTSSLGAGQQIVVFSGTNSFDLKVIQNSGLVKVGVSDTVVHFDAKVGVEYRVVVASSSVSGEVFNLELEHIAAHDLLSRAVVLEGESFEVTGSNRGATAQPFEIDVPHAGVGGGNSIWYQWTASVTGEFSLNTESSDTDTVLAVYTGDPSNPAAFTVIGGNDDVDAMHRWSRVDFNATQGVTYYIALDTAMGGTPGEFTLRGAGPTPPSIVSEPIDQTVPLGSRTTFAVGATGTAPFRYQWYRNGVALAGAWSATLTIDPVTAAAIGSYHVVVTNGYGSANSRTAALTEKFLAPTIVWSTGDLAVLSGQDATLAVRVYGSEPMTYSWSKDEVVLVGETQSSLQLSTVDWTDQGVYSCTITNSLGNAKATTVLTVVSSPFDSFTAVRSSAPNSPIASISVIDGKCYAVASERIMVSTTGRSWTPWYLPGGFDGSALAKHDGKWYCSGYRVDGKFSMAISLDGTTWQEPVEMVGIVPPYGGQVPISQLVSFNGRLVAAQTPVKSSGGVWQSGGVYYSTDGINWTVAKRRKIDTTIVDLAIKCRFQVWNGKIYALGDDTASSVLVTSDGITWQESALPLNGGSSYGHGRAIGTQGNKLSLVCYLGSYSTTDGTTWTMDGSRTDESPEYFGAQVVSTGGKVYGFSTWSGTEIYRYGNSTVAWSKLSANPPGRKFTAAVEFDGAIVCGASSGWLGRIQSQDDFNASLDDVYAFSRIEFLNDEFIAYRPGINANAPSPSPLFISGDGRRWRAGKSFSTYVDSQATNPVSRVYMGGRYFSSTVAGWHPASLSSSGLPAGVVAARAAASDGTRWLVIGSSSQVYSVSLDGSVWTPQTATNLYVTENVSLTYFAGKWFACSRDASTPELYTSADGLAWSKVAGVAPLTIEVFNSKLCALSSTGATLYETTDGVVWSSYSTGITAGTIRNIGSTTVSATRLLVFQNKLITMVSESLSGRKFAFYSGDARNWFRGATPVSLQDIATGNNMLVGVTSNGSVLVSGSTGVGGASPLANISYPAHKSTHVSGSTLEIVGSAVDPEGQAVTTECFVDGTSLGTSTASSFRFQFKPTNPSGHVVSVRSRDAAGLVGSDEIKLFASPAQLRNTFEAQEGLTYLPQVAWTSFGGRAYVAGQYSVYRTRDDGTWEPVLLPSLSGAITHIVAGNGALIVQTASTVLVTRDGVSWTQMQITGGSPIAFRDGWFTTRSYDSYLGYTRTYISQDGLTWTMGSNPGISNWAPSAPTITPGGSLLVTPAYRSIDNGTNWIPMPEFGVVNSNTLQYATAFGASFAGFSDGRIWRSIDDGRSWQQVAQLTTLPTNHYVRLEHKAGRLYWGGGGYWLASSEDGVTWNTLTGESLQTSEVLNFDGSFVGFGRDGMVWSTNGHVWQSAKQGPRNPSRGMLAEDHGGLLVCDSSGGVWRSSDGKRWTRIMDGRTLLPAPASALNLSTGVRLRIGNTTVIGGTFNNSASNTYLWYTDNGGLDWGAGTLNGGAFSGVIISKMALGGSVAMAATSRTLAENNTLHGLWSSTDGRDWQQLWNWPGGAIADIQFHNNEWWCLGVNGELHKSVNNGKTWSADLRPPGLLAGRLLIRFDGAWVVAGTKALNLQGPNFFYVSTDGLTWTEYGAPGGETSWSRLAYAVNGSTLVITSSSGKVYTATSNALNWTNTATLSFISSGIYQVDVVGGKFCILNRLVSNDGVTWTAPTTIGGSTIATPTLYYNGLYVTVPNFGSSVAPYWSVDGLNWTISTGGALFWFMPAIVAETNAIRARDLSGAIWQTIDGKAWTRVREGLPDYFNAGFARRIVKYGSRLIATGTAGLLLYSDDDGRSWQQGLMNSRPLSSSLNEREIKSSPTELFAVYHVDTNYDAPICRHFRSQDGATWVEMPELAALNVMDYAWGGGEWLAICYNGSLLRSTDGGLSWSAYGSVPSALKGRRLTYYQGTWVAAATTSNVGSYPPIQLHTSPDGLSWTNRGDSGSMDGYNTVTPPLFFTGNGLLLFGRQPSVNNTAEGPVMSSPDGITWSQLGKTGSTTDGLSGVKASIFVPTSNGYFAFGSNSSTSYYWTAPLSGGSWVQIPALQNQIKWIATPDGQRLFLTAPGVIMEWSAEDLELTMTNPANQTIGVGDEFTVNGALRNSGSQAMSGTIKVNAWLSTDRFIGDGNDVYVGWDIWDGAAPDAGQSSSQGLTFTLPNTVKPGSHYLILQLDLPTSYLEANRANNTAIGEAIAITIPQRRLTVQSFGNGSVSSDQNAEFFPHGARIGFIANPGKGARFAGWGGDAFGSLSEALVVMDSDKTVEANFVSTAVLTLFTRGSGSVEQSSDDGIYSTGANANLTAVPQAGWVFAGWTGALSGSATSETLVMNTNKVVTARFSLSQDAWRGQKFSAGELADAAISGADQDPDSDGMANWREWLRGSDPKDRDSKGQGEMRREGNWMILTYTRMENLPAGHAVNAGVSTDLSSWSAPLNERVIGSAQGVETIEARFDTTAVPKAFIRIADVRPSP